MHIRSCTPCVHAPARLRGSGGPRRSLATHGTRTTAPRGRRPPTPCTGMVGRALAPTAPYLCGEQGGSAFGQLALWRLLSAPEHTCLRLPQASANQPVGPRWPAIRWPGFFPQQPTIALNDVVEEAEERVALRQRAALVAQPHARVRAQPGGQGAHAAPAPTTRSDMAGQSSS